MCLRTDAGVTGAEVRFQDGPRRDDVVTVPVVEPSPHRRRRGRRAWPQPRPDDGTHCQWRTEGHPQRNNATVSMQRLKGHHSAERVGDHHSRPRAEGIRHHVADSRVERAIVLVRLAARQVPGDLGEVPDQELACRPLSGFLPWTGTQQRRRRVCGSPDQASGALRLPVRPQHRQRDRHAGLVHSVPVIAVLLGDLRKDLDEHGRFSRVEGAAAGPLRLGALE